MIKILRYEQVDIMVKLYITKKSMYKEIYIDNPPP